MRLGLQITLDLQIDHAGGGGSSPRPEGVDMELRQ